MVEAATPMLGMIPITDGAAANRLLGAVAAQLRNLGVPLAGAVQRSDGGHLTLECLGSGARMRITQDLGHGSSGCRLDPDALEAAVAQSEAALDAGARLLIVNRFGKQEAEGRGFRPLIGCALADGIPVLVAVHTRQEAAFARFSEGMEQVLDPCLETVLEWANVQLKDSIAA